MIIGAIAAALTLQCGLTQAQDQVDEYPLAILTENPGIVLSPFPPGRKLDVKGLEPGSLALDPSIEKIFRIPRNAPMTEGNVEVNPIRLEDFKARKQANLPLFTEQELRPDSPAQMQPSAPETQVGNTPATASAPAELKRGADGKYILPDDLAEFLYYFQQSSKNNDPAASLAYFAEPVSSYFGKSNQTHSQIRRDRSNYIAKYPQRNYVLIGEPEILGAERGVYEVRNRVNYTVRNGGRGVSGSVSGYMVITSTPEGYRIVALDETKPGASQPSRMKSEAKKFRDKAAEMMASGGPQTATPGQTPAPEAQSPQITDVQAFVKAFNSAGESNEPSACVNFMATNVERYYNLRNPSRDSLITNRRNYIRQWPERKYWSSGEPSIRDLGNGNYEVVSRTGYEVRKGSRRVRGTASSLMRLQQTNEGLRIVSITED